MSVMFYIKGAYRLGALEYCIDSLCKGRTLFAGAIGSQPGARTVSALKTGRYVPDEDHVNVCLNCKKKTCKGICPDVRRSK